MSEHRHERDHERSCRLPDAAEAFPGLARIVLTTANLDPNHRVTCHSGVSSTDLDGMEIEVAGQTVLMIIVLWISLQLPLGVMTGRALVRANPRN
jgi:hypothetical protein